MEECYKCLKKITKKEYLKNTGSCNKCHNKIKQDNIDRENKHDYETSLDKNGKTSCYFCKKRMYLARKNVLFVIARGVDDREPSMINYCDKCSDKLDEGKLNSKLNHLSYVKPIFEIIKWNIFYLNYWWKYRR